MVNGRILEDELKRIGDFFDALSMEEFEEMALECGAGIIAPSGQSLYVEAFPKRYANTENRNKSCLDEAMYTVTFEKAEAA